MSGVVDGYYSSGAFALVLFILLVLILRVI